MTNSATVKPLLDSPALLQCEQLAQHANLNGKRARALLSLNNGESKIIASEKSSLNKVQVGYLITRFKKLGMTMFESGNTKKAVAEKTSVKNTLTKTSEAKKTISVTSKSPKSEADITPVANIEEASIDDASADNESADDVKKAKEKKSKKIKRKKINLSKTKKIKKKKRKRRKRKTRKTKNLKRTLRRKSLRKQKIVSFLRLFRNCAQLYCLSWLGNAFAYYR
ncbi:hypothetical protein GPUN_0456 [Glaciecola punicea ACAM 611]|uniref:Uncharacterized protein n=1 Tax=Glaciecola punicea ACAM 611 TaxID=1121923 RepID=H5T8G2_9ALTE|nr:hypothetical protein [Glaciecola punicea]GAB54603.1 hypothetical protein GPUN_0456 [Glaciecola punicea ACAM 611]